MGLFVATCPIRDEERVWTEREMGWLVAQFGEEALAEPVMTPTDDFFPGVYEGAAEDVRRVVAIVGARMGAEPNSYDIEFGDVDPSLIDSPYWSGDTAGTAGEYRSRDGRGVISISMRQAATPMVLVATVAHEFGHHRLLGERRIDPARRDQEPLTDLATVFFGFGIFTANASREFDVVRQVNAGGAPVTGWRSMRLGYLTEPMFGYALAYWAFLRGERDPRWLRHVDANPKSFAKRGLRYLRGRSAA